MKSLADQLTTAMRPQCAPRASEFARYIRRQLFGRSASKTLVSLLDQAFFSGASFATSVIVGRSAGKEMLGAYYLGLTTVMILRGVQAEIVTAPFSIFRQDRRGDELAGYSGSVVLFQILLLLCSVPFFLAAAGLTRLGLATAELGSVFLMLSAVGPFLLLRDFFRQYSFAQFRVETAAMLDALVGGLQVGGLFWLATHRGVVAHEVYVVSGLANLAACLVGAPFVLRRLRFDRARLAADWLLNWSFAKWALASQLICSCSPFLLPWLVAFACGEAEAGVSAACNTLIGLAYMFTIAVSNLLTPKSAQALATEGVAGLRRVLLKAAALFVVMLGSFSVVVYLFANQFLVLVYGLQYAGYGLVCFVLALALFFNSLSIIAGNGLWAVRKPRANLPGDVATLAATLLTGLFLVQPLGALGAALASLAGAVCGSAVRLHRLVRELQAARESGAALPVGR